MDLTVFVLLNVRKHLNITHMFGIKKNYMQKYIEKRLKFTGDSFGFIYLQWNPNILIRYFYEFSLCSPSDTETKMFKPPRGHFNMWTNLFVRMKLLCYKRKRNRKYFGTSHALTGFKAVHRLCTPSTTLFSFSLSFFLSDTVICIAQWCLLKT